MILAALVLAQYAGTLDIFETSRLDARTTYPFPLAPGPPPREIALAADAFFAPTGRLRLSNRRWEWALTYAPTFSVTDIELGPEAQPVVLNAGTASVAWHDRSVRVMVSESGSYGSETLAYLYGTPIAGQPAAAGQSQTSGGTTGTGQPAQTSGQPSSQAVGQNGTSTALPSYQAFPFGSSNTTASLVVRASRRVTVSLTGGYSLSGNLANNPEAALAYPEQYGPSALATVSYASSVADSFVTTASAQETTTPMGVCVPPTIGKFCRQDEPILLLQETARHRVSATASVGVTLGASAGIYQLDTATATETAWAILPAGGLSFTDRFSAPPKDPRNPIDASSLRLSADLAPTINVFTGTVSNRLQLSATFVAPVSQVVSLSLTAGALQTVPLPHPDPSPLTVLSGGVDLKVRMTRLITVSMGIQGVWQDQQNVGLLPVATPMNQPTTSSTGVGYIALSARVPTLRL
jgi:hypothetical protein